MSAITYPVNGTNNGTKIIAGRVVITGSVGDVGAQTGRGFTIAKTGTGTYTCTIDGANNEILHANIEHIDATVVDTSVNIISISGQVVTFEIATSGTEEHPAGGDSISVLIIAH